MRLVPYLFFNGNCAEALNFYKDHLNGEILFMQKYGDSPMKVADSEKDKVMHTSFKFGDNIIMACDSSDNTKYYTGNIQLSIDMPDVNTLGNTFGKMAEGGKITMPLQDTFWGARFGMLIDKYGIAWMFNCDKK